MNIPLDRLYHFIEQTANKIYGDHVLIYRFWPHGSKNINDLTLLNHATWIDLHTSPIVWCNDQEPLNFEFYQNNLRVPQTQFGKFFLSFFSEIYPRNLNFTKNIFEKNLLLHSEKRSNNIKKYQEDSSLIPVYYWSHAIIARDWFRYAKNVEFNKNSNTTFLIYNRAWSNTREYRLCFVDLLIKNKLLDQCKITCNTVDPESEINYIDYQFCNPQFKPTHKIENFLQPTQADSSCSADFVINDYNQTDIEVVLETLFDDERLHLTEKILRPIACRQPFILAATHGSLDYLRGYGFQTYDSVWDESYDLVSDPRHRLEKIVGLMKQISQWDQPTLKSKLCQAQEIANFNQQWFFSKDFFDLLVSELDSNLTQAFEIQRAGNNYKPYIDRWKTLFNNPLANDFLDGQQSEMKRSDIEKILQIAQKKLSAGPTDI